MCLRFAQIIISYLTTLAWYCGIDTAVIFFKRSLHFFVIAFGIFVATCPWRTMIDVWYFQNFWIFEYLHQHGLCFGPATKTKTSHEVISGNSRIFKCQGHISQVSNIGVTDWVKDRVTDKTRQWSYLGPIKMQKVTTWTSILVLDAAIFGLCWFSWTRPIILAASSSPDFASRATRCGAPGPGAPCLPFARLLWNQNN